MKTKFIPDVFPATPFGIRQQIDLNGPWGFRRDPDANGRAKGWHTGRGSFTDKISIPGAPQAQGMGKPTREQKHFFLDPFWVRRTFRAPDDFTGRRLWLRLGGVMPAANVFLNGRLLGYTQSSRTPQRVDITPFVQFGDENLLAVQVCAAPEMRLDGVMQWGGAGEGWTGLYRPVCCEATGPVALADAYIRTQVEASRVAVSVELSGRASEKLVLTLTIRDGARLSVSTSVTIPAGARRASAILRFPDFTPWSPAHPTLYRLELELRLAGGENFLDAVEMPFGMREISTRGNRFMLNGAPFFLKCFGDDHYYPDTLCPPADVSWFRERLLRARSYGFNAVKSCNDAIPAEYMEAADEAGMIVFQEMPFGLEGRLRENRHRIDRSYREYYLRELDGIVRATRNHASVLLYAAGAGEMLLGHETAGAFRFFSQTAPRAIRRLAPHALVIDGPGMVDLLPPFYLADSDTPKGRRAVDFLAPPVWKDVLEEPVIRTEGRLPLVLHEYLWWSCYPDAKSAGRYRDTNKKPWWLDQLVQSARRNRQLHLLDVYRRNSLRLQALCRKDGMEYARRNPAVAGYIMWLLIDLNRWSEGLLDDFWRPKNVSAAELLECNGETIALLAQDGDRSLRAGARVSLPLAISHYGETVLSKSELRWALAADGGRIASGTLRIPRIQPGSLSPAGSIRVRLPDTGRAYALKLDVGLKRQGRVIAKNRWDFRAFPETAGYAPRLSADYWNGMFLRVCGAAGFPIPKDATTVAAQRVDPELMSFVNKGGACLLFSNGSVIENNLPDCNMFRTIPWNRGESGNSGTVIERHPALAAFPHGDMCDLNFVHMIKGIYPLDFGPLLRYGVKPIIRAIDHYLVNRNKAYMLEFRVGKGRVLATSLDVIGQYRRRIEARCLFACLADYVMSDSFRPQARLPAGKFLGLFQPREEATKAKFQAGMG